MTNKILQDRYLELSDEELLFIIDSDAGFRRRTGKHRSDLSDIFYSAGLACVKRRTAENAKELALAFLNRAAELGHVNAARKASVLCLENIDEAGKPNAQAALRYLQIGADRDDTASMRMLGILYRNEELLDHEREVYWLTKAADKNDRIAMYEVAMSLWADGQDADRVRMAIHWFEESAKFSYDQSMYELGAIYDGGFSTGDGQFSLEANPQRAYEYYFAAAEKGHAEAMTAIGLMYLEGYDQPDESADCKTAVRWFQDAYVHGSLNGKVNLAYLLYHGDGIEQNYEQAMNLWLEAAGEGHPGAMNELGDDANDRGDYVAAESWWNSAAEGEDAEAIKSLIDLYEHGAPGIEKNRMLVRHWAQRLSKIEQAAEGQEEAPLSQPPSKPDRPKWLQGVFTGGRADEPTEP